MIINIAEAKAKLSILIDAVMHGEKVVIAKNNLPLVDLIPHKRTGKRTLGLIPEIEIPDSFNEEDNEINELFHGKINENNS
ncbi:MAG: type II toxin-antitoxin system prevent-host-death family antitoxin [Candidatus Marinimicrobia bacterium]|nr:type II toxin-antitoxin system prevent-host-death family antitoxin [Candidatus Neomarinimicrobiota bacterium]